MAVVMGLVLLRHKTLFSYSGIPLVSMIRLFYLEILSFDILILVFRLLSFWEQFISMKWNLYQMKTVHVAELCWDNLSSIYRARNQIPTNVSDLFASNLE